MEDKARYVAIKTLYDIETKGAYSNIKLNHYFQKYELAPIDRGFATEILYGTLRWKKRIDYTIKKFSSVKLKKIAPWSLACLRCAIYEIYFLDKVPDFATVNEAVNITKIKDKKNSSFVNGVLRSILRNREDFYNIKIQNKIQRLAVEYSHPEWLVEKFIRDFGEKRAKQIMENNNKTPKLNIRVNTLKTTKEELISKIKEKGAEIEEGIAPDSLKIKKFSGIEKSEEFNEGLFTVQDESSQIAVLCLNAKSGDRVMDLCSAPGGKTTYIAQNMGNKGEILAFDIHEHKIELINDISKRLGIDIINASIGDATKLNEDYIGFADKVLVDVPCSGIGIMRKKPEIRWNITEDDINSLKDMQIQILNNASKYINKNGEIVYSTCTITKEENEEIIESFLNNNNDFELVSIENEVPFNIDSKKEGYVKLLPGIYGTDGFFIAKLKRKGDK